MRPGKRSGAGTTRRESRSSRTAIPPPTPSIRPASCRNRSGRTFCAGSSILNTVSWGSPSPRWCCIWTCPRSRRWRTSAAGRERPTTTGDIHEVDTAYLAPVPPGGPQGRRAVRLGKDRLCGRGGKAPPAGGDSPRDLAIGRI